MQTTSLSRCGLDRQDSQGLAECHGIVLPPDPLEKVAPRDHIPTGSAPSDEATLQMPQRVDLQVLWREWMNSRHADYRIGDRVPPIHGQWSRQKHQGNPFGRSPAVPQNQPRHERPPDLFAPTVVAEYEPFLIHACGYRR